MTAQPRPADTETLVDRVRPARCGICRERDVLAVCSACHDPMCRTHDAYLVPIDVREVGVRLLRAATRRRERRTEPPRDAALDVGAVEDRIDIAEETPREHDRVSVRASDQRHLCPRCVPWDRWSDRYVRVGLAGLLLGLIVVLTTSGTGTTVGCGLIGVGLGTLALRLVLAQSRHRRRRDLPGVLTLDPQVREVRITETVEVHAELAADQTYTSSVAPATGRIDVDARWSRAQAHRLDDHRELRFGGGVDDVPFVAGYLVVSGEPQVAFDRKAGQVPSSPAVLRIESRVSEHSVLGSFGDRGDGRWAVTAPYSVTAEQASDQVALWIVPTLLPRRGGRSLALDLYWHSRGERRYSTGLRIRKLDLVRVRVPALWGPLESWSATDLDEAHPIPKTESPDAEGLRAIEWRNVELPPSDRGRHVLRLHFGSRIPVETSEIRCRVEARYTGAVSGASGVAAHFAGGARRPRHRSLPSGAGREHAAPQTVLRLDARLSLAGLRYQDVLTLPGQVQGYAQRADAVHTYPVTVPGHDTMCRLADALSERRYFVKRIAENPARSGDRPMSVNRTWDIGGRYYDGVYPITFDLVVSGEEADVGGYLSGSTLARLDMRGAYANEAMQSRILAEWTTLWSHIDTALSGLSKGDGATQPALATPLSGRALGEVLAIVEDARARRRISDEFAVEFAAQLRVILGAESGTGEETR